MVGRAKHVHLGLAIGVVVLLALCVSKFTDGALLLVRLNQLPIALESRIASWDGKATSEERLCRSAHALSTSQSPIPNIAHFILLSKDGSDVDLSFAIFLAFKAAVVRMDAGEVRLHTTGLNTQNRWWQEISKHVTLVHVDTRELRAPDGTPFTSLGIPHQADLLRLSILARDGGIYLDTDVYTLRPFKPLLSNPRDVVMGHEGGNRYGLCNAVILARPDSQFISLWEQSYASFHDQVWNEHSVRKPKQLQTQHPDLICPLSPSVFFWPTWAQAHVEYMHGSLLSAEEMTLLQADLESFGGAMYEDQLAFHAWGAHQILQELTPEKIETIDTRFNVLLREIVKAPL